MSELTALTIANARDGLKQKKFSAAELADAHLAAIEKARSLNAYVLETPERASAMAKAADARIAKAQPARWKVFRLPSRTCSARKVCGPQRARTSSTISCRPTSRP
jgi:Asp-tRNAAsn/Glu-tRNAGln amidotransferase A subunit and related amidases